jgi:ABC-type multidrug transport system ATPase subunit
MKQGMLVYLNGHYQGVIEKICGKTLIVNKGRCGYETERFEIKSKEYNDFTFKEAQE